MTERAELYRGGSRRTRLAFVIAAAAACAPRWDAPVAVYDPGSRRLVRLDADVNHDGVTDQWLYMNGNRALRSEIDSDADGRVDRWEYYGDRAQVMVVGTSSRRDGVEDTWTTAADARDERRIDYARARDRRVDRREFYVGDRLTRAEEDTNADGLTDKWEEFDGGRLRQVALDTRLGMGRPDRRLLYDAQGHFASIEVDDEGKGRFVPLLSSDKPEGARRP